MLWNISYNVTYIDLKKIQITNNDVRATQDISKSATEVTRDFAKWLGFQVTWSEDRKRSSDLEAKFQVTWTSRTGPGVRSQGISEK